MRTTSLAPFILLLLCAATAAHAEEAKPAGGDQPIAISAPKAGSPLTFTLSATAQTGRPFLDQGFTLTDTFTNEFDATLCKGSLCFDYWTARTGTKVLDETDYSAWYAWNYGKLGFKLQFAEYHLAGPDVPEAKLVVSYPLSTNWSGFVSYEKMVGGFKENVSKVGATYSHELSQHVAVEITPAVAHSTAFHAVTANIQGDIAYTFDSGISVQAFTKAYAGKSSDVLFGIGLSKSW